MPNSGAPTAKLVPVAVGGAFGATLRWAVLELIGTGSALPVAVIVVNAVACLALGMLAAQRNRWAVSTPLWSLAAVGFCGGLSTFSALTLHVAQLFDDSRSLAALTSLGLSVLTGVAAVVAGQHLGRSLARST